MKRTVFLLVFVLASLFLIRSIAGYETMPIYNAEDYDAAKSLISDSFGMNGYGADCKSMGGSLNAGDYLVYEGVSFDGMKAVMLEASALYTESGKSIELRLDAADGTLVGTFSLVTAAANETADNNYVFKESYITFSGITGTHDVYLVFLEDITFNLDYFVISTYDGTETVAERNERMKWWNEARYGQFIHWSSFSRGKDGNGVACWDMTSLGMTPKQYANEVASKWDPEQWDAGQIVANAQKTGQKYIVITTRHHNGFSLFDTNIRHFKEYKLGIKDGKPWFMGDDTFTSPYDIDVMGDPMKALSDACLATQKDDDPSNDVHFGTYYTIMDWSDKNFNKAESVLADGGSMGEYKTRLKGQMKELMVDIGTDLLWGDGDWLSYVTPADGVEMYRFARTIKPSVIINDRVGNRYKGTMGDYATPEQEVVAASREWESCLTMSAQNEWSYRKSDTFKDEKWVLDNIFDCFDNSGNALLNIGPNEHGIVPESCMDILYRVGDWLKNYDEAVYGTVGSPYKTFNDSNLHITSREGAVYVYIMDLSKLTGLYLPGLENEIISVTDLYNGKLLEYKVSDNGINIDISDLYNCDGLGGIVKLTVEGTPKAKSGASVDKYKLKARFILSGELLSSYDVYYGASPSYEELGFSDKAVWTVGAEFVADPAKYTMTEDTDFVLKLRREDGSLCEPHKYFDDISDDFWGKEAVGHVLLHGLFAGVETGRFAPDTTMTRAMLVTVLWRMDNEIAKTPAGFTDITTDAWYAPAAAWADENDIVPGDKLRPDDPVTREELADMLYRYAKKLKKGSVITEQVYFTDSDDISREYEDAVAYCTDKGIFTGYTDRSVRPKNSATRAEVATMIMRFEAVLDKTQADEKGILENAEFITLSGDTIKAMSDNSLVRVTVESGDARYIRFGEGAPTIRIMNMMDKDKNFSKYPYAVIEYETNSEAKDAFAELEIFEDDYSKIKYRVLREDLSGKTRIIIDFSSYALDEPSYAYTYNFRIRPWGDKNTPTDGDEYFILSKIVLFNSLEAAEIYI